METKKRTTGNSEDGWTFIETIIVIAIIMILTSSVGFMAFKYVDKAKTAAARSQIETLSLALNSYFFDVKNFPSAQQGIGALWTRPDGTPQADGWDGPYIEKEIKTDPWGNEYRYEVPGPNGLPFGISSFGADGMEGGEGNNADINSWQN
ncbi:MAG: type II secretion system major pseudopilin GspG [Spirochaetales bacterium]|nr:type II secretion system major pseudopilin GspG [Spirochaetales bacterium]